MPISSAEWYRRAGSFAIARSTTVSSSGGIAGTSCRGGTGGSCTCFMAIATAESPVNGTRPVSISYSTTPTE